jgi:hypothetical protein
LGNFNLEDLEKFVCVLYGHPKESSVNKVRTMLFTKTFYNEQKPIDLCNLPPCFENLHLHCRRSNYVSDIYQWSGELMMNLVDPTQHGWNENGDSVWSPKSFPDDLAELLLNYDDTNEDELDLQCDADDDDIGTSYNPDEELEDSL